MRKYVSLHFEYNGNDHSIVFENKHLYRLGPLFEEFLIWKERKKWYTRKLQGTDKHSKAHAALERKRKHASEQEKRSLSEVNDLVKKETVFFYTETSLNAIVNTFHCNV